MIGYHHFETYNEMTFLGKGRQKLQKLVSEKWLGELIMDRSIPGSSLSDLPFPVCHTAV